MSTRYRPPGSPLADFRYASSPEYTKLRGINGTAVAARTALLEEPCQHSLIFFLQALSMRPGGLSKVAAELIEIFPGNVAAAAATIAQSPGVFGESIEDETAGMFARMDGAPRKAKANAPGEQLLEVCRQNIKAQLPDVLIDLCVNPECPLPSSQNAAQEDRPRFRWFRNVIDALYKYQQHYAERVRKEFVFTAIGEEVWRQLDYCLKSGQLVVIEGREGVGKSEAVRAWAEAHLGEARLVNLTSLTNRTTLFRGMAKVLNVGASLARMANDMQNRVEDCLHRTKLMVLVDEAHYLLPQSQRIYSRPELLDWVYSGLTNSGVPAALICTPQFSANIHRAEKQTGWNAAQFKRRVRRFIQLPERQSARDLEAIARKLLPGAAKDTLKLIVGYAGSLPHQLDAITDTIREAKYLAEEEGAAEVKFEHVRRAIDGVLVPTALAKVTMEAPARGRQSAPRASQATPEREPRATPAQPARARDISPRVVLGHRGFRAAEVEVHEG